MEVLRLSAQTIVITFAIQWGKIIQLAHYSCKVRSPEQARNAVEKFREELESDHYMFPDGCEIVQSSIYLVPEEHK